MNESTSHKVAQAIIDRFTQRTPTSRERDAHAKRYLPGGDTRTSTYYAPYPAYMERGEGCYLYDSDGNKYIDFLNNYTSLIHGHAHPPTVKAVTDQVLKGTVLGSAAELTARHAETLCNRVQSLESVRYCNSGTEATLFALRAARAFTGKDVIVKMDGGFHGTHDYVEVNISPDMEGKDLPRGDLACRGVPAVVLDGVLVVPFNGLTALEGVLRENSEEIAAIILEPVLGAAGGIEPLPGYLQAVRELADRFGVLLVFDEIVTFRLDLGGLQSLYGITPDLTALGKIIGGGLPVGAFGGRREIMAPFDPAHPASLGHSGTFNGNNLTMAAGLATLEDYGAEAIARINALGQRLKRGISDAFRASGVLAQASGTGSILRLHWREGHVENAREARIAMVAAGEVPRLLHLELMNRGVFCAPRGQLSVSTPMTEQEIDAAVEAFGEALEVLRPYIAERTPHLVDR